MTACPCHDGDPFPLSLSLSLSLSLRLSFCLSFSPSLSFSWCALTAHQLLHRQACRFWRYPACLR